MRLSFGYTANAKKKSPKSQAPPILVSSRLLAVPICHRLARPSNFLEES